MLGLFENKFKDKEGLVFTNLYYKYISQELESKLRVNTYKIVEELKERLQSQVLEEEYIVIIYDASEDADGKILEQVQEVLYDKTCAINQQQILFVCNSQTYKLIIDESEIELEGTRLLTFEDKFIFNDIVKEVRGMVEGEEVRILTDEVKLEELEELEDSLTEENEGKETETETESETEEEELEDEFIFEDEIVMLD